MAIKTQHRWFRNRLVAYEAIQGLVPGRSSYTDTDESVVMLSLNSWARRREAITTIFKVFGQKVWPDPWNQTPDLPYQRWMLYHCATQAGQI